MNIARVFPRKTNMTPNDELAFCGFPTIEDLAMDIDAVHVSVTFSWDIEKAEELYEACHKAREILRGKHGVGRVIARPFVGETINGFKRTSNRHDYSLEPPAPTMLAT